MTLVHVVTSCTDRKRTEVRPELHLRAVHLRSELARRASEWVSRLEAATGRMPARKLYAGEHWAEFLRLLDRNRKDDVELRGWVISAGYGLISVDAALAPYQATFAPGAPDSVVPRRANWTSADWWTSLAQWAGPTPSAPRTLGDLLDLDPDGWIVIAASGTYLKALAPELETLAREARDRVTLFAAGNGGGGESYAGMQMHYDSRVLGKVGGSRVALNIRVLGHALNTGRKVDQLSMRAAVKDLMRGSPPVKAYDRKRASDEEVSLFIRQQLRMDATSAATPLLRLWRSEGRACEQKRFKDLFEAVRKAVQGERLDGSGAAS